MDFLCECNIVIVFTWYQGQRERERERERECIIVLDLVVGTIHTREKISWYSVLAIEEVLGEPMLNLDLHGPSKPGENVPSAKSYPLEAIVKDCCEVKTDESPSSMLF
ncbi:hypothetical protein HID58_013541 [Brassica napus]|uniref:Uncharacterized protein n=1 Tax=Brassica napus TaxID=3708 RepID=A0ABQ8E463_BRANA|nr:hypothetical protein HID58_013541 [Brassica napus]